MNTDLHSTIKTVFEDSLTVRRVALRKSLPRRLRSLRLQIAMYFYSVSVLWRIALGRWCVFQDTPDWVVFLFMLVARRRTAVKANQNVEIFLAEAVDEWHLRKRKRNQARINGRRRSRENRRNSNSETNY